MRKAWLRLDSAFRSGTGHVVVTAATRQDAADLVDAALERSSALAVLRVRAASNDPLAIIDETREVEPGAHLERADRREVLRGLLENARALDAKVFTVVEDADEATAEELERVRMAIECLPEAIERLRVVLVGTPRLDLTLSDPAASALASRVSTHVRLGAPSSPAKTAALNTLSSVRLAAAGMMTVAVTALFGRSHTVDSSRPAVAPGPTTSRDVAVSTAGAGPGKTASAPETASAATATTAIPVAATPSAATTHLSGASAGVRATGDSEVPGDANEVAASAVEATVQAPVSDDVAAPAETAPSVGGDAAPDQAAALKADVATASESATSSAPTALAEVAAKVERVPEARSAEPEVPSKSAPPAPTRTDETEPARPTERIEATKQQRTTAPQISARLRQPVVMEAAAFKDAEAAYALQRQLATKIDQVLVARLDGAKGVVYSVRVVGLATARDVAHAEREIRTLGHRPVRIAAGSSQARGAKASDDAAKPPAEEPQPRRSGSFGSRYRGR